MSHQNDFEDGPAEGLDAWFARIDEAAREKAAQPLESLKGQLLAAERENEQLRADEKSAQESPGLGAARPIPPLLKSCQDDLARADTDTLLELLLMESDSLIDSLRQQLLAAERVIEQLHAELADANERADRQTWALADLADAKWALKASPGESLTQAALRVGAELTEAEARFGPIARWVGQRKP